MTVRFQLRSLANQILAHITTFNESPHPLKSPPSKLVEVFEKFQLQNADLNFDQQIELVEKLDSFHDLWDDDDKHKGPLTRTSATSHPIDTHGDETVRCNPHRTTPSEDLIIWQHIGEMVRRKVILFVSPNLRFLGLLQQVIEWAYK